MNYGGEETVVKKIEKLESYLAKGLPRYQEVLEQQNKEMPQAPDGIEYLNPRNNGKSDIYCINKKI